MAPAPCTNGQPANQAADCVNGAWPNSFLQTSLACGRITEDHGFVASFWVGNLVIWAWAYGTSCTTPHPEKLSKEVLFWNVSDADSMAAHGFLCQAFLESTSQNPDVELAIEKHKHQRLKAGNMAFSAEIHSMCAHPLGNSA